jgi:NitT/TauT family transport system ATP-binding protein
MEGKLLDLWAGLPTVARPVRRSTECEDGGAKVGEAGRKTILFVTHDLEEAIALADEVVVLSAGPESHVVARHAVTIDRPRDLFELRTQPAFVELYRDLWAVLRDEVIRSRRA